MFREYVDISGFFGIFAIIIVVTALQSLLMTVYSRLGDGPKTTKKEVN